MRYHHEKPIYLPPVPGRRHAGAAAPWAGPTRPARAAFPAQRRERPAAASRGLLPGTPEWHALRTAAGRPAPANHRAAQRASGPLAAPAGAVQPLTASDESLTEQWVARYSSASNYFESATALAVDAAGNVYVTGYIYYPHVNSADYVTIKYSPTGQELWRTSYSESGAFGSEAYALALAVDATGNVYVTGTADTGDRANAHYATIKYSPTGQQLWVASYNGPGSGSDYAAALAVDPAGNVYVTGASAGSSNNTDYATLKYSPSGQELWVARYNGPANGYDYATALALDAAGNVHVTGASVGSNGTSDYATVKYAPTGEQLWSARYEDSEFGSAFDVATALAVDAGGNVYVAGYSSGGYALVKYKPTGEGIWSGNYTGPTNQGAGPTPWPWTRRATCT
ncbi:hypothetical protein ACFQT0_30055 [Hymenobacter humi]|uniref:Bulb-type lectin domain-containing protein n=1 Tax=Hymenobacter humi TaxID=1411620 RepID=A0ABW2UFH3_9BACT